VPVRWLVGPGLLLVGVGLLLMRGLDADSSWTHLLPGFIVAGLGSGLVNAPLASTAIGVVPPQRAGMASGINTTFRQVGIATSVAALGSIFATKMSGATPATSVATYANALNELLLIAALLALAAGAAALALIRQQDFVAHGAPEPAAASEPAGEPVAA
jgi:vacuolar-type H+-ATPase subunit I/STV1